MVFVRATMPFKHGNSRRNDSRSQESDRTHRGWCEVWCVVHVPTTRPAIVLTPFRLSTR